MKNEKMLKEAPVWKLLCSMSLPMILIVLVQVLYNMADVISTVLALCLAFRWKQEQEKGKKKPLPRPVAVKA